MRHGKKYEQMTHNQEIRVNRSRPTYQPDTGRIRYYKAEKQII